MSDLIDALRTSRPYEKGLLLHDAADEIERLNQQIEMLKNTLEIMFKLGIMANLKERK